MLADKAKIAMNAFLENLSLFDRETSPEKYMLYKGLIALSEALIELGSEVERIKREVRVSKGR